MLSPEHATTAPAPIIAPPAAPHSPASASAVDAAPVPTPPAPATDAPNNMFAGMDMQLISRTGSVVGDAPAGDGGEGNVPVGNQATTLPPQPQLAQGAVSPRTQLMQSWGADAGVPDVASTQLPDATSAPPPPQSTPPPVTGDAQPVAASPRALLLQSWSNMGIVPAVATPEVGQHSHMARPVIINASPGPPPVLASPVFEADAPRLRRPWSRHGLVQRHMPDDPLELVPDTAPEQSAHEPPFVAALVEPERKADAAGSGVATTSDDDDATTTVTTVTTQSTVVPQNRSGNKLWTMLRNAKRAIARKRQPMTESDATSGEGSESDEDTTDDDSGSSATSSEPSTNRGGTTASDLPTPSPGFLPDHLAAAFGQSNDGIVTGGTDGKETSPRVAQPKSRFASLSQRMKAFSSSARDTLARAVTPTRPTTPTTTSSDDDDDDEGSEDASTLQTGRSAGGAGMGVGAGALDGAGSALVKLGPQWTRLVHALHLREYHMAELRRVYGVWKVRHDTAAHTLNFTAAPHAVGVQSSHPGVGGGQVQQGCQPTAPFLGRAGCLFFLIGQPADALLSFRVRHTPHSPLNAMWRC